MTATVERHRSTDLLRQVGPTMYRTARERNISLSALLEQEDPSLPDDGDGLDAFGRLLKAANIRTTTLPEFGVYADEFGVFEQDENTRALVPEWIRRQWKRTTTGRDTNTRALYLTGDEPTGSAMFPFAYAATPRVQQIAPAIPLAALVTLTTPINSDTYKVYYLQNDPTNQRMVRVAQGAELPRAKLVGSDHTITLHKFGRALEVSYEQLRRQRIDLVALHIQRMAVQSESDKVAAALDVLTNGDGSANTAPTVYNLTTLDSTATVGTLTLKAWIAFKLKFTNPYMMTTAMAQDVTMEQAMLLNTGTANIPLVTIGQRSGFGGFVPINPNLGDNVAIGWTPDAPSGKIVAFDNRFALEHVTEIGSDITETERWIARQSQILTMSENESFATFDQFAIKILNLGA